MAFDAMLLQNPMNPEPIKPRLLDRNNWKEVASAAANLLLKVGEAGQQFADITALNHML